MVEVRETNSQFFLTIVCVETGGNNDWKSDATEVCTWKYYHTMEAHVEVR